MSLSCTCLHVQSEFKNLVSWRVNQRPAVWLLKIKFRKSGNRRQSAGSTHFHMFSTSHLSHFVPLEYSFVSHTDLENKECATSFKNTSWHQAHTHTHRPFHLLDLRAESFILSSGLPRLSASRAGLRHRHNTCNEIKVIWLQQLEAVRFTLKSTKAVFLYCCNYTVSYIEKNVRAKNTKIL